MSKQISNFIDFVDYRPLWHYTDFTQRASGYYFWDEVQNHCCGPYETQLECEEALREYAETLERK